MVQTTRRIAAWLMTTAPANLSLHRYMMDIQVAG